MAIALVFAAATGILSHLTIFIRGEHHIRAPEIVCFYLAINGITLISLLSVYDTAFKDALSSTLLLWGAYCIGLFGSITLYRLFFHKLRHFPGPLPARITKLWHACNVLDAKQYLLLERWHKKFGDFVRTGPNEITVFRPDALKPIHSYGSKCSKSAWYDNLRPYTAMNTTRSKLEHDRRRRVYDQGMSIKAVQGYEERVQAHAELLNRAFQEFGGSPVNITKWFQYFGFDMMGELGFGKSFDQVKTGKPHFETEFLRDGMSILATVTPAPWLYHLALSLPKITAAWLGLLSWSAAQAKLKMEKPAEERDIMSWIIDDWSNLEESQRDLRNLGGDAIAIVIAGSQTVAAALIFTFYRLAKHPDWAERLRTELASHQTLDPRSLQSLPLLNAFINETFRLHPPVPSAGLRDTPPEGIMVGECYIPGGVTVLTPNYSIGRLESCYERADEFLPERWCSEPHLVKDKTGFRPFGLGPYSCVGKNLALLEIRTVTALLVKRYEISFAPGEDCAVMFDHMKDVFTASPGKCELVFAPIT